jgi:hypothetical protein
VGIIRKGNFLNLWQSNQILKWHWRLKFIARDSIRCYRIILKHLQFWFQGCIDYWAYKNVKSVFVRPDSTNHGCFLSDMEMAIVIYEPCAGRHFSRIIWGTSDEGASALFAHRSLYNIYWNEHYVCFVVYPLWIDGACQSVSRINCDLFSICRNFQHPRIGVL